MERPYDDEREPNEETILDAIGRWLHAFWTWLGHARRRFGRWVKKRGRLLWVDREIDQLKDRRNEALLALGGSVYATFRHELTGRPELMTQVDQIQQMELALARKRRLKDRIEREELE